MIRNLRIFATWVLETIAAIGLGITIVFFLEWVTGRWHPWP